MPTKAHATHFCPSAKVHVKTQDGFDACITEHQCFSDDPCPLLKDFWEAKTPLTPLQTPRAKRSNGPLAKP